MHGFLQSVHFLCVTGGIYVSLILMKNRTKLSLGSKQHVQNKKYTLWSNFRFVFTPVWKEKRSYIRDMITGIILSVIVPVIGSMLSALVVGLLGESLSAVTVIAAILSAFVGYALVNAADTYIRQNMSIIT